MKTISLKLTAALNAQLDRAARQGKQSKSEIVRAALVQFLNGAHLPQSKRGLSALDLAGDLAGSVDGPGDLSTNPAYMEGFGR